MSGSNSVADIQEQGGRCVLGVHLDVDSLRVVEMNRGRIANWSSVPYPENLHPGSKDFPEFLKGGLDGFQSAFRHASIWIVGPTPSLQVRFLSLPKARPRQMANMAYWTFRKEIPFDPAQTIFDYDGEGDISAPGPSKKIDTTAYTVAQTDVDSLVGLFARAGLQVDGIVIPSFALRNLFRSQPPAYPGPTLGLYVGEEASSLLFFKGKHVVSHRVFKTGMNVVLDVLRDRHADWSVAKAYQVVLAALVPSASGVVEDPEQVADTIHVAFGRLVQQVERSMSAYLVGQNEEEIKHLQVAGAMAKLSPLVAEMGSRLGLDSQPMNGFQAGMMEEKAPPPGPAEAGAMAIALGAALSDASHTPNLLHTYVKRMQEARHNRMRMIGTCLGFAWIVALALAGLLVFHINRNLREEWRYCQNQIQRFHPAPDRALIQNWMDKILTNSLQMKSMAIRSVPIAALNQLATQTPGDIRLTAIEMESKPVDSSGKMSGKQAKRTGNSSAGAATANKAEPNRIRVQMEGLVLGAPAAQESKLASYVLRLEDSEMFEEVALIRSEEGREGADPVLLFALELMVEDLADEPPPPPLPPAKGGMAP